MMPVNLNQAVILAGGLGSRLKPITDKLPKPMVDINGKPFITYLLDYLSSSGVEQVIILSGYKSEILEDYIGNGANFGINVVFSKLDSSAETSERIYNCREILNDEFLLMYCDNFIPLNLTDMTRSYFNSNKLAQISVYRNKYLMTKNNLLYSQNELIKYDKERGETNLNGVNIGYMILNKQVVKLLENKRQDFESALLPNLIKSKEVTCFLTDHKYYSIGSKERLPTTRKYFKNEKFILLDRDGVLNKKMPKARYVTNWKEWEWRDGSLEGLEVLKKNSYKVIIISNQPGISRGFMTEKNLEEIHSNMKMDAIRSGGEIHSIYVCKCNWNDGCDCRKPKPGMIFNAQYDYDFVLNNTYFLGDDERDMEAAKRAGCKGLLIGENDRLDHVVKNILRI
tara:strand:+ start:396 stop:1586 length:1191 start_codon:yes stop_codon:yes gene_type:complete